MSRSASLLAHTAGSPQSPGGYESELASAIHTVTERVNALDWAELSAELDAHGNAQVTQTTSGPLYRVALGSDGVGPYARVRTVQARTALQNQMGVTWQ